MSNRKHPRAPACIAVAYRTTGNFLVAYSVNLSKGGIFVEAQPLPVGTEVHLALEVSDTGKFEADGVVAWIREANPHGLPIGMGIQFLRGLDVEHGQAIDAMVSSFEGMQILLFGAPERRAMIGRYVTSILSCETVEADTCQVAEMVLADHVDLLIVDLESSGVEGMEVVKLARKSDPPTPLIALATDGETQQWAREQGVDQVVRASPAYQELQQAVIAALSRGTSNPTT